MKWLLALTAVIFLAPATSAAINGPQAFDADFPFMQGVTGDDITLVSGEMDAHLRNVAGAFGFFGVSEFEIRGVERACYVSGGTNCETGDLTIKVIEGSAVGMDFPGVVSGTLEADHALAMFIDFAGGEDLNTFDISQSLLAPTVGGEMVFESITGIPFTSLFNQAAMGGLVGLDSSAQVQIVEGGVVLASFTGKQAGLRFEGQVTVTRFTTDLAVVPFERGSTADFAPAGSAAADEGLKMERVDEILAALDASNSESSSTYSGNATDGLGRIETVLSEVLNGAVVRVPSNEDVDASELFAVIRFDNLEVLARTNDMLDWEGSGPLAIQGSQVAGAPDLVGWKYFSLPWWSFALWAVALGTLIARITTKAPKQNETWDRYKWVGWVFGGLSAVAVFILWDFEVRAVWGTSVMTTEAAGEGLLVTIAIQFAPLLYVLGAVAAPLRMIFRNGLMLSKQGTFMGLSGGVSYLMAYAIGAPLLLAYIEIIIASVLAATGG